MISREEIAHLLPYPDQNAHKYSRGKCVVVAGCPAYPGAACLAAQASQFAGAGYSQVFTAPENVALLHLYRASLVVSSFDQLKPADAIKATHKGAFVVGSGFDAHDTHAKVLTKDVLEKAKAPVLLDGGALSFVAEFIREPWYKQASERIPLVLTPHAGEAQHLADTFKLKLSGMSQIDIACTLAQAYNATVVLKGPNTVVATSTVTETITRGTAVLSKAGTGDVLAGTIGGLLAQGMQPFNAAVLGVYAHAEAGRVAEKTHGIISACAEEVLASLPQAFITIGSWE